MFEAEVVPVPNVWLEMTDNEELPKCLVKGPAEYAGTVSALPPPFKLINERLESNVVSALSIPKGCFAVDG